MVNEPLRCLIVDDELPARVEMRRLLSVEPGVEVVGEAADVETALRLVVSARPELIFLDVQLVGETGFDFVSRAPEPCPRIVFVTAHERYALRGFESNALDYLVKPVNPARLSETLRRANARHRLAQISPAQGAEALRSLGLTVREAEVLFWIARGKTNPEIAEILTTSSETVKKQVQKIFDRLQVDSRVTAALRAVEVLGLFRR